MVNLPLLSLLRTVLGSILEVGILCVAGYVLARKDILDKRTQKMFNIVNVSLFTPALLFSKVAFSLTPAKLKELWIIPIVFIVTTLTSMLVAYSFSYLLGLTRSQRAFAMAAAMFMNSNSFPVALMQSIILTSSNLLKWQKDDTKDAMIGRALSYLVLYSSMGMVLRWSYGVRLLSRADTESSDNHDVEQEHPSERTALITSANNPRYQAIDRNYETTPTVFQEPEPIPGLLLSQAQVEVLRSIPPSPTRLYPNHTRLYSSPSESTFSSPSSPRSSVHENNSTLYTSQPHPRGLLSLIRASIHKVNELMTMPMWAAFLSIIVACIPPLQNAILKYMKPINMALNSAGGCSIPVTLVVLGAYFHTPKIEGESGTVTKMIHKILPGSRGQGSAFRNDNGGAATGGETKTVFVAVTSRMILTPLVLLPVWVGLSTSLTTSVFEDPVFILTNVLLVTSAPALTLAQLTQAASGDAFERLVSRTIFWAYCVLTPISTVISVLIGLVFTQS
ncbi:hypothetical protein Clacol_009214 [Clathrus columnatus]|uniref:Auxin efflux carrier n=1 Tax=Clathrus columnatus TaxID=1419009 RepID=A0AAV5AP57_9AGAM|nr:hypothetical protein Clacol_009214 [Clathrus columnatus]